MQLLQERILVFKLLGRVLLHRTATDRNKTLNVFQIDVGLHSRLFSLRDCLQLGSWLWLAVATLLQCSQKWALQDLVVLQVEVYISRVCQDEQSKLKTIV